MRRLRPNVGVLAVVCGLLTFASCECEERIRDAVSRDNVKKRFSDAGESSLPHEEEPNNAREQATLVRFGNDLRDAAGRISEAEDVDWFSVRTDSGEAWLLTMQVVPRSTAFDPRIELEVEPSSKETVVYDSAGAGEPESVRHLGVSSEVRRIGISGGEGTYGPYRIKFSRKLTAGAIEREPNDLREAATSYEFPGEIQGYYDREGDRDWYHVVRSDAAPGIYEMRVESTGAFPQTVQLYTGRDAKNPYVSYQVSPASDLEVPNVRVPEEIDGLWFRFSAGSKHSRESGYGLRLVEHPESEDYLIEAEPNGTAEQAVGVTMGETVRGYLHAPSDLDRFQLAVGRPLPSELGDAGLSEQDADTGAGPPETDTAEAERDAGTEEGYVPPIERVPRKSRPSHVVQAGLKPLSDSDRLALVWWRGGPDGEAVTFKADAAGEAVKLCNRPIDRGLLHLGVRGVDVERGEIQRGFTYELAAVDIVSEVEDLEIEPNDERRRADRLTFGTARTGYISRANDRDLYAFGISDPRRRRTTGRSRDAGTGASGRGAPPTTGIQIALKSNELNLGFQVLDGEGGLVAEIDRNGAGADESTELDLPPGLYYVRVASERSAACQPYELTVRKSAAIR